MGLELRAFCFIAEGKARFAFPSRGRITGDESIKLVSVAERVFPPSSLANADRRWRPIHEGDPPRLSQIGQPKKIIFLSQSVQRQALITPRLHDVKEKEIPACKINSSRKVSYKVH
jgi:hypothetical protein